MFLKKLLDFQILLYYSFTHHYCANFYFTLWMLDFSIPSGCGKQFGSRSGPTKWVQTVCKGYQQTAKFALADKELNTKQLVDTTFWLNPWLKLILIGFNCWLQQILSQGKPCVVKCQKGLDKQCRPRSDCFWKSSLGDFEQFLHNAINQNNFPAEAIKLFRKVSSYYYFCLPFCLTLA